MPSPRAKPQPLSDTDIQHITDEITAGRPPAVWFTSAAVGVEAGRSGKVIALGDPSEGDFLQVRPTGSKDAMSFSPVEVTLTKPAKRPTPEKPMTPQKTAENEPVQQWKPAEPAPKPTPAPKPAPTPTAEKPARPASTARKAKSTPEVSVTITGTTEGEWSVEVLSGKKRAVRNLPVAGAAVAIAAAALHPEVAAAIDAVLEETRNLQRAKVEALQAELEQARRMLDELT